MVEELPENPFMANEEDIRLSLAGAQEKLPVYIKKGKIHLSLNGSPSSHILKTPIKNLPNTVENETYCMMLAKKMGLNVPEVKILKIDNFSLYIINRYDRKEEENQIVRLVQEDFCQAMNVDPQLKYKPTLQSCFQLIKNESSFPIIDNRKFLRLIIFNGLIGNCDGHAKNISFIHDQGETFLAPFYDLLSTYVYPLSKRMAMRIGGKRHFHFLLPEHFEKFAKDVGIKYGIVKETLLDMANKSIEASKETTKNFNDLYGQSSIVDQINIVIKNGAQKKRADFSS